MMVCSSCGAAVTPGLSYCNRCGAELTAKGRSTTRLLEMPIESLVWAIVVVAVVGVGALIGLMALMKLELHFNDGLISGFSLLCLLPFLAAETVFIWMLIRSISGAKKADEVAPAKAAATREIGVAQSRALPEPAPSITEHTTRTFESAQRDAKME